MSDSSKGKRRKCNLLEDYIGTIIVDGEIMVNGAKVPPCPTKGCNITVINNKVYLNGYELIDGKWKRTLKALIHKWF